MNHKFRIHSLTAILLALTLASCSSSAGGQGTGDTTPASDATDTTAPVETIPTPELPDTRWDGETFTFYCRYGDGGARDNLSRTLYLAESTGDVLDDAIYSRMLNVSERFGIKFEVVSPNSDIHGIDAQDTILSGDDAYQLVMCHVGQSLPYVQGGMAADWLTLPYVDFDNPWWSRDAVDNLTINGSLYIMSDDITHNSLAETMGMVFIKQYLEDDGLEAPYQLVRDGKWTLDKLNEYAAKTWKDINGDTELTPDADRYGYLTDNWAGPCNILCNAGIRVCEVDADGTIQLTVNTERTADVLEDYLAFMNEPYAFTTGDDAGYATTLFRTGHSVFTPQPLMEMERLRTMEMDYGVLPLPKYDESIDGYPSLVNGGSTALIVPVTVKNTEMVSAVLEAMCWENYYHVMPAYYEKVLKVKTAIDTDDADMMDIIRDGRVYDIGYFFAGSSFRYVGRHLVSQPGTNFASYYAEKESAVLAAIEEVNTLFAGE